MSKYLVRTTLVAVLVVAIAVVVLKYLERTHGETVRTSKPATSPLPPES